MELRDYQKRVVDELVRSKRGRRVVVVAPTGSGKTVIAAAVIKKLRSQRVVFIAHRKEILRQTVDKLADAGVKRTEVGVISAGDAEQFPEDVRPGARVQVCGVQTLVRRDLAELRADIVFVDEAHHTMADSYRRIINAFPNASVYGLTATPQRRDGKGLGGVFNDIVVVAGVPELIASGHLAKPITYGSSEAYMRLLKKQLRGVKSAAGDFNQKQLGRAMADKRLCGDIVKEWLRLGQNKQTVLFAASVALSKNFAKRFQAVGVNAEHVDGESSAEHRAEVLAGFHSGEITMITNVDVLGEGWDESVAKCIVMARPTRSITVYMQQVGRTLRPYKGERPIILDHAGNCARFGLADFERDWSLDDRVPANASQAGLVKACPECERLSSLAALECECGHVFQVHGRPEGERDERLELIDLADWERKVRLLAQSVGAPDGWAEKVMHGQV